MRRDQLTTRRLAALAIAVLALHAMLLRVVHDALPSLSRDEAPKRLVPAMQVRTQVLAGAAQTDPVVPSDVLAADPAPGPARIAQAVPRRSSSLHPDPSRSASPTVLPSATPSSVAPAAAPNPHVAVEPADRVATDAPAASATSDLPVYRTRLPPAFAFGYDLRRGGLTGSGELQWRPQGDQYRARLAAASGGAPLLAWDSVGGFDEAGLAPARYTDRRRGRGTQAANFQRDAGKITFSGPAIEHALPPGAQDRLSWMLQLAAIAAAEPSLIGPGGRVLLLVVGARGDADVWTFVHAGEETLALPDGDTPTVRLLREPRRPYDTRAEVWLAPGLHYLPVRARLSNASDMDALQLVLREVLLAP